MELAPAVANLAANVEKNPNNPPMNSSLLAPKHNVESLNDASTACETPNSPTGLAAYHGLLCLGGLVQATEGAAQ